ncbi:MAG: IS1595 family transposase [Candidatus Polarisedimenticolia bacterium]
MSKGQGPVAGNKSETVRALPRACADETAAVEFIEAERWQGEPACPRCGDMDVYQMISRETKTRGPRYLWRCRGCARQFTVRIGTIFEDSRIPMRHWCYAFWAACASKKGVSALQIKRMTGLSYKSALFMMHRIRFAMAEGSPAPLTGIVEADETYVGGKPRKKAFPWKPARALDPDYRRHTTKTNKATVVAVLQRGGSVRPRHVERANAETLRAFIFANVSRSSILMTDESNLYTEPGKAFKDHKVVKHSTHEYVRGNAHTNSIEGFFSIVKRSLYGTHHAVSKKHLHRYLSERAFVYNARHVDDGERTVRAIRKADGKRLTYKAYLG